MRGPLYFMAQRRGVWSHVSHLWANQSEGIWGQQVQRGIMHWVPWHLENGHIESNYNYSMYSVRSEQFCSSIPPGQSPSLLHTFLHPYGHTILSKYYLKLMSTLNVNKTSIFTRICRKAPFDYNRIEYILLTTEVTQKLQFFSEPWVTIIHVSLDNIGDWFNSMLTESTGTHWGGIQYYPSQCSAKCTNFMISIRGPSWLDFS